MVNRAALDALTRGEDPRRIAEDWGAKLDEFQIASGEVSALLMRLRQVLT